MERSACIDKCVKGHSPGRCCFVAQQACSSMKLRGWKNDRSISFLSNVMLTDLFNNC